MNPPPASAPLVLGGRTFGPGRLLVMAVVNRTPDSFYPGARQYADDVAADAVAAALEAGADIVDVGGVKAGPGEEVDEAEEMRRVVPFVERTRAAHPDLLLSVDTWRSSVAERALEAGACLLNDTWAGHDGRLPEVAAAAGAGLVCSHTGGAAPRTRPHRVGYGDAVDAVVDHVVAALTSAAARAVAAGIAPGSVLVDPTHDFGKNTWHGLSLLRHTDRLVATGYRS